MKRIPLERIYRRYILGSYHWRASCIEILHLLKRENSDLSHYFDDFISLGLIEVRYTHSSRYPHYCIFRTDLQFSSLFDFGTCNYLEPFVLSTISLINNVLGHEKS